MPDDGTDYVEMSEGVGVTDAVMRMITMPILAIGAGLAGLVETLFGAISSVISSLEAVRDFIWVLIADGPTTIMTEGAAVTSAELSDFGIAAFAVAVAVIAVAWMAWNLLDPDIPLLDNLLPWR